MKKCMVFCAVLILMPCLLTGPVRGSDAIKVGVYQNEPKIYLDNQGEPAGLWIDLLEYIAAREGWRLAYVAGTWQQCLERLERGEIDILPDVGYSDQRAQIFRFNEETVLSNWAQMYTHESLELDDIRDLAGKRLAFLKGDIAHERFKLFNLPYTPVLCNDYKGVFEALKHEAADAGVISRLYGLAHENDYPVRKAPVILAPCELRFAFPLNSDTKRVAAIDRNLAQIKKDPQSFYHQTLNQWFGERIRQVVPKEYKLALAVAVILVALFVFLSLLLKKKILARTRELKKSEERYRIHFENASDVIYSLDSEFRFIDVSPSVEHILGYRPEELAGKRFPEVGLLAPEDMERAVSDTLRVLAGEEIGPHVYVLMAKDGRRVYGEITSRVVTTEVHGTLLISAGRDVTERKHMEEELRERARFIRTVLDNLPIGIAVNSVDPSVKFDYMNDLFPAIYRTTREALMEPDAFWNVVYEDPEFREEIKKRVLDDCAGGDPARMVWPDIPITREGSETTYITAQNTPVPGTPLMISTVMDVTPAKAAREELRKINADLEQRVAERTRDLAEARDRMEAILTSVADGLVVTNHGARVVLMNPAAETLLGTTFSKIEGQTLYFAIENRTLKDRMRTALEQRESGYQFDFEVPGDQPDRPRILRAKTARIQTDSKSRDKMVIVISDMTLEREVDRMKTDFLSTAAHELRTPLTSIQGFSELLLTRDNLDAQRQKKYLGYINTQAVALGKIIGDLLDITRIEAGRGFTLDNKVFDLGRLFKKYVNSFRARSPGHAFEIHLPETPVRILADRDKMEQLFENLLSNAVKYSPRGGKVRVWIDDLRLSIEDLKEKSARPSIIKHQPTIQIRVADDGIGMTPEQIERVFDKFWRADASNKAVEGTGLGMSIVKHIVEAHGGRVWVESEGLGKGTTVVVELPLDG